MPLKSDEERICDGLDVDAIVARLRGSSVPAASAPDASATRMMEAETPIASASPPPGTGTARRRLRPKQAEKEREEAILERVLASAGAEVPADAPIAAPTVTAVTGCSDAARDEPGNELAVWAGITAIDNPEFRWRKLAMFVRTGGSTLGRWLALFQLQVTWGDRELAVRVGYIPPRATGGLGSPDAMAPTNEIPNLGILFRAIHSDIGVPKSTAYREIEYARTLLDRFGPATVFGMLGRRIANDDRFLRDLARLEDEAQGRDALSIYVEGAGEVKAKEALKSYLGVQGERRRLASAPDAELPPASGEPDVVAADVSMHQAAAAESAPRPGVSPNGGSALRQTDQSTDQARTPSCAPADEQGAHILSTAGCAAPELAVGSSVEQVSITPASLPCPAGREVLRLARDGTPTPWNGRFWRLVEQTDAEVVIEQVEEPDVDPPRPPPGRPLVRSSDGGRTTSHSPPQAAPFAFDGPPLDPIPSTATNVVSFIASADEIARAVKAASIVEPGCVTPDGQSGFLFVVGDDPSSGVSGHVVSRNSNTFCKVPFVVRSVGTTGRFAYPGDRVRGFKYLEREELAFNAYTQEYGWHTVSYVSTHGASSTREHCLDPRLFDDPSDCTATRLGVNGAVLQAALEASSPFLGTASADEDSQVLQLVSARTDGQLFANDKTGSIVFESDALRDRDLIIHRKSVKGLLGFLSRASGTVEVGSAGPKWSVATANGRTFGWARQERALSIYGNHTPTAGVALSVGTAEALDLLRSTRTHAAKQRGAVRVAYTSAAAQLCFVARSDGKSTMSMKVSERAGSLSDPDYWHDVDIGSFLRLLDRARSEKVELHLGRLNDAPGQAVFRTVEEFEVEGHRCRVTRSCACIS